MSTVRKSGGVGVRTPLIDGQEKVRGAARYTADLPPDGALVGRILRSPRPHAEILSIDLSAARALPGVVAVLCGEDCATPYGIIPIAQNEFPLARGKVRYMGEPVAAVAAVDEATAEKALELIRLELRELPSYVTAAEARSPDAVRLHDDKPGNLEREVDDEFGDVEAGFEAADLVREKTFYCDEVTHVHIEPHAAVADYDVLRDHLTFQSVSQVPYYVHLMLAQCLGMDSSRIRIIKPFIGGGFGARTETLNFELVCGLLARAAGGRVRMILSREETFLTHRGRPAAETRIRMGLTREGKITAVDAEMTQLGGAYGGYGIVTILYSGALLNAIYDIPAVRYQGFRVYTNTPPCGAMRGHGTVDMRYAFEALLNQMAQELGLDAFAVRRANLLCVPMETINGLQVTSYGLPEALDWVESQSRWAERRGKLPKGRGLGLGCSHFVSGAAKPVQWTGQPDATVTMRLDFDGNITVFTGATEIGQGSSTVVAQVATEVLGLDHSRVRVVANDSALTPKDNGSYSSRVTYMVGNATLAAAEKLKQHLLAAAARKLDCEVAQVECHGEEYRLADSAAAGVAFGEVVKEALIGQGSITEKGAFIVPRKFQGGKHRGAAVGSTMGFSYAATVVEVSVDEATGEITVEDVWVSHDTGYAINPLAVEGQIQGAVWMGMGQAMMESTNYRDGLPMHANMLDYRIPTMLDSPPIHTHIVESIDPNGPFGAKEASEGGIAGFMPAFAQAVSEAIGVDIDNTPITPDRIVDAVKQAQRLARLKKRPQREKQTEVAE
ncbi:MAG: 4-hydroxybenzoyl-CoA reductase subunit alpha [Xanthomonadales bacterium]|nr:4-hydroxybenzoyl-CoA reductase subunit alpha [Xanthomonadales bacterium]